MMLLLVSGCAPQLDLGAPAKVHASGNGNLGIRNPAGKSIAAANRVPV